MRFNRVTWGFGLIALTGLVACSQTKPVDPVDHITINKINPDRTVSTVNYDVPHTIVSSDHLPNLPPGRTSLWDGCSVRLIVSDQAPTYDRTRRITVSGVVGNVLDNRSFNMMFVKPAGSTKGQWLRLPPHECLVAKGWPAGTPHRGQMITVDALPTINDASGPAALLWVDSLDGAPFPPSP